MKRGGDGPRGPRTARARTHAGSPPRRRGEGWGRLGVPWPSLIAVATGILSGMSIGGGSLLVPALVLVVGVPQHVAQGVVLATFPVVAAVAAWVHWRQGFLRWRLALRIAAGSAVGAALGARLAVDVSGELLRRLFGLYLVGIGMYALYRSRR
ncbi:sulfite exporter TauE/SafE family protein [Thermaerobacter composti]|uniref:Probable membrane transporter protein n=1 Tax=Thermaerobacter composti TaxID=554949 RepID=A0ABZ0QS10_9FIRM|nr:MULTISPECIES: sulfite exporter TauE/SafE family protein [Thermaerobacter]WPD19823.1 sulfite exporter TauE/SafE family protein [Thermaerobacter composti]